MAFLPLVPAPAAPAALRCARPGHPRVAWAVVLLLAGCFPQRDLIEAKGGGGGAGDGSSDGASDGGGSSPSTQDTGSGATPAEDPLRPSAIIPDQGPDGGGYTAEVRTTAGDAVAAVSIGGTPAEIVSRTAELVRVLVPPLPVLGAPQSDLLEVRLDTASASATVPGGFRAWSDATDLAHVLVQFSHVRWIDVEAARAAGADDELSATAWTIEPTAIWPEELAWSTTDGGCAAHPGAPLLAAGGSATLRLTDSRAFPMTGDGTGQFHADWAYPAGGAELPGLTGQSFHLDQETSVWPSDSIPDGLVLPPDWSLDAPTLSEPATDSPQIDAFRVAWSGAHADRMGIHLRDLKGGGEVWCIVENTGEFMLPADATAGFASEWGLWEVELTVWALHRIATTVQYNNGQVRATGATGYRGRRTFFDLR